jgi:hypothetical protein
MVEPILEAWGSAKCRCLNTRPALPVRTQLQLEFQRSK